MSSLISSSRSKPCERCGRKINKTSKMGRKKWLARRFCSHECHWANIEQDRTTPVRLRIENKIMPEPNSGCWLWDCQYNRDGYGLLRCKGTYKVAHRLSYEQFVGPIPNGLLVLHRCDVPSCVNPAHLFLGTYSDNTRDMIRKGRAGWQRQ